MIRQARGARAACLLAAAAIVLLGAIGGARAQDVEPYTLSVSCLGGPLERIPARVGAWVPLDVAIESRGPPVDAILRCRRAGAGRSPVLFERRVAISPGARRTEHLVFRVPDVRGEVEVALVRADGAGGALARAAEPWRCRTEALVVGVSDDGSAGRLALASARPFAPVTVASLRPSELPPHAEGLELAAAIIVAHADLRSLTPDQGEALRGYVEAGGRLMLVFSGLATEYRGTAVDPLLPCDVSDAQPLALAELAQMVGADDDDPDVPRAVPETTSLVAHARPLGGAEILYREASQDLALRRATGAGTVTYLAIDATRRSLASAGERLCAWLLDLPETGVAGFAEPERDTVGGRLAAQAANVGKRGPPPFALVGSILAAYGLLAVPVNYVFWRRRRRLEMTAPTAVALSLAFVSVLYGLAVSTKGRSGLASEAALIEARAGQPAGGVIAACGLFAPERRLAGIDARLAAAPLDGGGAATIRMEAGAGGPARRLDGVELDQWSLRLFALSGPGAVPAFRADLEIVGDDVRGTIAAPPGVGLEDVILAVGRRSASLPGLAAGGSAIVSTALSTRTPMDAVVSPALVLRAAERLPIAADGALPALILGRLSGELEPLLAPDFDAPGGRPTRDIAISVSIAVSPGRVSFARMLAGRVVDATAGRLGGPGFSMHHILGSSERADAPRSFQLQAGRVIIEWTLPVREGFVPRSLRLRGAPIQGTSRVSARFVGPGGEVVLTRNAWESNAELTASLDRIYDPRRGTIRLVIENGARSRLADPRSKKHLWEADDIVTVTVPDIEIVGDDP